MTESKRSSQSKRLNISTPFFNETEFLARAKFDGVFGRKSEVFQIMFKGEVQCVVDAILGTLRHFVV